MTIAATLIPDGPFYPTRHHARAAGNLTLGAGDGELPAAGANQLLTLPLPFPPDVVVYTGYADQIYILAKSMDGNVTDIRLDAVPVTTTFVNGYGLTSTLQLRVDATALPAQVDIWIEAHHSAGI